MLHNPYLVLGPEWAAGLFLLVAIERPIGGGRARRLTLAVLALALVFAIALALTGEAVISTAIALSFMVLIGFGSRVKYVHKLENLVIADIWFGLRQGMARFLAERYPGLLTGALAAVAGLVAYVALSTLFIPHLDVPLWVRIAAVPAVLVLLAVDVLCRGPERLLRTYSFTGNHGHFLGFMASIAVAAISPLLKFEMLQVSPEPSDLVPPRANTAGRGVLPHVILIHHESTFDPGLYGLPVTPEIERFLRPEGGLNGRLRVEVFGGSSWMTEFSVQTGLSPNCFGRSARYIFQAGEDRFRHALPSYLKSLGYSSVVAAPTRRNFLNYSGFYTSIGVDGVLFAEDFPPELVSEALLVDHDDELFYRATEAKLGAPAPGHPELLILLSNFNHGPHTRRKNTGPMEEDVKAFARTSLNDEAYAEYLARLDYSARAYAGLRRRMIERFAGEPILFIRYGDHQPEFVANLAPTTADPAWSRKRFETFYSIEGIGLDLDPSVEAGCECLDVAFLTTLALRAGGLPLNEIYAAHADLIGECGPAYFETESVQKARFHRLLIDRHLVIADVHRAG